MKVEKYLSVVLLNFYKFKNLIHALRLIKNCFDTKLGKTDKLLFPVKRSVHLATKQLSKIVLLFQNSFALEEPTKSLSRKQGKSNLSLFLRSMATIFFLSILSPFTLSSQVTLTLEPSGDCDIDSGSPTTNWGTCEEMWVTSVTRTLTKFDVSSIPAGAKILSASISLYQHESPGTNGNIEIRKITNAWNEGSGSCSGSTSQAATWNQRVSGTNWTTAGGDFSATVYANCQVGTAIKYYTWNITTLVQEWVDGTANHGLIFKNSTESGAPTFKFYSSEATSNKPVITITYSVDPLEGPVMHTADQKTSSGSGNAVSVAKPDNVSEGDLILLVFSHQRSSTSTSSSFTTPSGFNLIRSEHDITSNNRTEVVAFYKIASNNEPSTYTSSVTTYTYTPQWKAYAVRVTGFDPYDPIDTHVGINSGSTSIFETEIPALAVAKDHALIVSANAVRMAISSVNVPLNMFLASFVNGTGSADDPNNATSLKICYQNQLSAGNINPVYHSWVGSARASGLLFGINPENDLYCAGNKLVNSGFESQASQWGTWGAPTYSTDKRTGDYAAQITDNSSGFTQDFIGSAGKTYTVTAYAKGSNTNWTNLTIEFFNSAWTLLSSSTNIGLNTGSSYAPTSISAIAPAGTYYVQLVFGAGVNSGGYVQIDDICLIESDYVEAPGGVTGSAIWLKANKGLSTGTTLNWADQSGFNRNGLQTTSASVPTMSSAAFNYNPALTFDGSNDNLTVQNLAGLPTGAASVQMFAVANHTNTSRGWNHIFSYGSGSSNQIFGVGKHSGTANATTMLWSYDAISSSTEFANNQVVLVDGKYTGSQAVISSFGTQKATISSTGNKTTNAGYIGVDPVLNSGTYWQGNISEVLVYPGNLTTSQVLRINSYLALKYGITLNQTTAQNYMASDGTTIFWNGTTNSSHKNNIAGIVRDDVSGLHQKQSKSSNSGLQIAMGHGDQITSTNVLNTNSISVDKSALVWGDNNGSVSSWTTTGAPSGYSVVARSWKVQETGTVSSVKLQVASSAGSNGLPPFTGGVFLLVDADGNFTSGATVYTMTLNGVNYETNVDLSNGQFFTFATCTTIGNPVFALGISSTRCQGSGTVTYTATSSNSTGMSYTLDAGSLSGGNTINASTGAVTFIAGWSGTSTITATATGCGGPKSASHTVTITPSVGTPVFTLGSSSSRCIGSGTTNFVATATNSTGITYTLDALSLIGGNSINGSTGAVTFSLLWAGTSVITATAAGCNGPISATHTVETGLAIGNPSFLAGSTSTRCQGSGSVTYTAISLHADNISYILDATSLSGGNTINPATGEVTYSSTWSGTTIITVTATGCGGPKTAIHTVTINGNVQTPVFNEGTLVSRCGQAESITFTATAQNSTNLSYSLDLMSTLGGNSIQAANGTVTWNASWVGSSTITATAQGCNGPLTASLIVESAGVFAVDDAAIGTQGKPLYIQLTTNDLCNYNSNSITIVSPPQSGNVQMGTNGQVVYLPAGNFSGNDAFVYQICQTSNPGVCDQATVNVTIEETFIDPCAEATRNKTYYLPFEENSNLRNVLLSAGSVAYHSNTVRTLVSIKIPYPGINITYDHWEDGYESNIQNPSQSTTQIWGDGNLNNGIAPGYADDILPPGAYIVLDNQFQYNPRVSSTIAYDGKDKIFTTGDVSISKVTGDAGFGGGSVLFDVQNLKTNVYDISRYGEYFVVPFGEDVTLGSTVAFRYTGIYVKAAYNGTQITFDYNADGVVDFTQTLNQGEFWYYTGTASQPGSYPADVNNSSDIKAGAVVTASQPVGVDLIFGDGFNFGTRNMALLPSIFNANKYFTPVYTSTPSNSDLGINTPVYVFFTNVLDEDIDITWTSKTSTGTFTIPANGIQYFEIPYTASPSGYKFESSNEEPFAAITIVDADSNGSRYDWAFNLIPEERLTEFSSIAWAPGSRDGAGNYNPIWVTPVSATTLYIKNDGNLTGLTATMSPCGIPYDLAVPLDNLSSYQIFDNTDNDQSGTAIYTCDGTKFVAVWGQNSHANGVASPPGTPSQDVGYVLEPKCLEALIFANDDSRFTEPNTPITIAVTENDFAFLSTLNPSSVNTIGLLQPANGSTITHSDGTITYTPNNGFIGTDYFEYRVCSVEYPALCDVALVTVRVSDCPAEDAQNLIYGKVFIEQLPDDGQYNNESPAWGVQVDLYLDSNCNNNVDAGENVVQSTLSDPSGNYSFSVLNGFNAADNFEPTPSFTNNNGGTTWSSAWIEQNDDLNVNSGYVRIMADASSAGSGNAIRLSANGSTTLRGISRSLTFSGATAATLKFKFRRQALNNQGEQLQVLINGVQVLTFDDGDYVGTDANYTEVTYNLSSFNANGSNVVLFRVNSTVSTDDYYWIDNVELIYFKNPVCYITKINPTGINNAYTASLLNQQSAVFSGLNACVKDRFLGVKAILTATDDVAYTSTNVPVIIPVLLNDVTGKPNPQTVTTVGVSNQPANGTVSVLSDGTIQYEPNPGFNGNDDFEYLVCSVDDPAVCDVALVTVQVSCVYIPNNNSIIGKIFSDNNLSGTLNTGENGMSGVILNLVRDFNGNGQVDISDQLVESTTSNSFGDYQFIISPPTTDQTYADAFNTNGSGSGSTGTTSWLSNAWTEINETNGLNSPSIQVAGNQLNIQGDDIYYLDAFSSNTTANQSTGTVSWTGQSWVEIGETNGFATTPITITSSNGLRVSGNSSTTVIGARRSASLSGAGIAQLSFVARVSGLDDQFDYVDVEVASSSSGPWTNLTRISGPASSATYYYDLVIPVDLYASGTTIRFVSSGVGTMSSSDIVYFDDIKISYRPVSMYKGISRTMNLSSALEASLQLNYTESGLDFDAKDYIDLEIAPTSSGPWTLLRRFTGADGNQSGLVSFDISAYKAAGTTMRFTTSPSVNFSTANAVLFDNILVTYKVPSPANYIVQLAQPLPQDITLTSPTPSFTYAVAFTGAGEGSCNKSFGVARANLSIVKSASAAQVNAGGSLSYTLTVTNNGPSRSTNTVVNDVLPTGFSATSTSPSQGSWASPNWTIGTLEPGQSATLVFAGNVSTAVCDEISNTANVAGSIADPISSNNSSSVTVNVIDNIAPVITHCPSNITLDGCSTDVLTGPDFSSILTESDFDVFGNVDNAGVSSDNCGNESVWYKDSITSQCPITIQRKWFVRDIHTNESQCTQIITIQDIQAPQIINAPADITLNACSLASVPPAAQNFADFENIGGEISDNCTPLENIQFTVAEVISGSCPTLVSRTYSIKDNCLNTATVVHNIYVHDTSAPEITAPDTTIQLGCNPVSLPDSAMVAGIISLGETCGLDEHTITAGPVIGDCHKSQPFYIMAKDLCQNETRDTVVFTWTSDNQAPVLQGFNEVVNLGINPDSIPSQNEVLQYFSVADACNDYNFNVMDSISAGTCQKSKLFAFEVADVCGNIIQDSILFTWTDSTLIPVVSEPGSLCVGNTTSILPGTGGHWESSNPAVATIDNSGNITAVSPGSAIFTFTRTSDGCSNSSDITVLTMPTPPILGDIEQPTCSSPSGSVTLEGLPAVGPWTLTRNPGGIVYTGSGISFTIDGLVPNNTYTFTATNAEGCVSQASSDIIIESIPSVPTLGGPDFACIGTTASMTPSNHGSWSSSNPSIATINNSGIVSAIAPGMVIFTFTKQGNGCQNTKEFSVIPLPSPPLVGNISQPDCQNATGSVVLTNLPLNGNWTLTQMPGNISINGSGSSYVVDNLNPGVTYNFSATNMYNCSSGLSSDVIIQNIPNSPIVNIDYMGSVCLEENKTIGASVSSGTSPFSYDWTGPNGFEASASIINISQNGNYYLTITDANQCTATTSGFVYESYTPLIVSLQTQICEGQHIDLTVSGNNAVSYQWSENANAATSASVNVVPLYPNSTYQVTVTNDQGCTAVPQITIFVTQKPEIDLNGPQEICVGQTSSVLPSSGGSWVSTNTSVASVSNQGLITGIGAGNASFIFTSDATGCASDSSVSIMVHAKPMVEVLGPESICIGSNTQLSPTTGGSWYSNNPEIASVDNTGLVTGLSQGSTQFYFIDSLHQCSSDFTSFISVDYINNGVISGPSTICQGSNIVLIATDPGGIWNIDNPSVAVINNSGIVTGISAGTATVTYTYSSGSCAGIASKEIEVLTVPETEIIGSDEICVGSTTTLNPSSGGIWTSADNTVATVTNDGIVTGIHEGYVTFTFQDTMTGCVSNPTSMLAVHGRPEITLTGPATLCLGQTTSFLPNQGGTWVSSNPAVATVSNSGIVTSLQSGSVYFTFTSNQGGCTSLPSTTIQIGTGPTATLDFHGSPCLTDNSQISVIPQGGNPTYSYQWSGPLGFQSNLQTVSISDNGMYYATVTDSYSCKVYVSGFIYQRFDPFIVNLQSNVCEGSSVQLSVNASSATSYQWSANAGNSMESSVLVYPTPPISTYQVTVTNNIGCTAVAEAGINVYSKPVTNLNGPSPICIGQTTQMNPTSGGSWSSTQPSVATINNSGIVTGIAAGSASFIFTQQSTGCISDTSAAISVLENVSIQVNGPSSLCIGQTTQATSGVSGTWSISNPTIAQIDDNGLITALSPGTTQVSFSSSNGCISNNNVTITVHDKPAILLDGPNPICIGATTQFLPSAGGSWVSTDPAIASINYSGLVTGILPGTVKFLYTNTFTGCTSDSSVSITILPGSPVSISGPNPICVGSTTTLAPTTGGIWISNHPSVASVTNAGIVSGLNQGTATFTFINSSTGCASVPTEPITIHPRPVVSVTGPSNICIGNTTSIQPATGGTWISSHPSIASIDNLGIITGLSAGMTNFVFTQSNTGCTSLPSSYVTISAKPIVSLQTAQICVGNTTTATPAYGGTWISNNPAVATINNNGVITGVSQGTASFIFTETATSCSSVPTNTLTVLPRPEIAINGPNAICQGATTQMTPTSGGAWMSLQPTIATITNTGLVTGVSNGTAQFVFTSNQGCTSQPSEAVTVHGKPVVSISGPSSICIGSTTQLLPSSGGTWTSSRPSIASINNNGLVTAISLGTARFIFVNSSTGCKSDSSSVVTVNNGPIIAVLGNPNICLGQTGQLSPTVGGSWTSLNTSIATVNNSGLVTGIGVGQASFTFTQNSTGCASTLQNALTVLARPVVSVTGPSPICAGNTSQLSPTTGGSWMSQNMSVATVNNSGLVTGVSQGLGTFVFIQTSTGCTSLPTSPIVVMAKPSTILDGPNQICVGGSTQFFPATGGTWNSNMPTVATINNSGIVTGLSAGTATFTYIESATGCISNPSNAITVNPPAQLTITGPSVICLGYTTTLSSSTSGSWYSHNEKIARVSAGGLVTGVAPGKVSFYFVENATGCIFELPADAITVVQCTDPDFNVTFVNINLQGNVKTNDEVPTGTIYQNTVYLISKPDESMPVISVEENGNYNFVSDKPGVYIYHVMVCLPGTSSNCPLTELAITVVNPNTEKQNIISNLDIVYTYENQSVTFQTMANDTCIAETGCQLNKSLMSITHQPSHGSAILLPNGTVVYTPASQFVGMDTIIYQVCSDEIPTHCVEAKQIVTVMAGNALNALVASDDFFALSKGGTITGGDLVSNDFDPEGDPFTIIQVGTSNAPVSTAFGTYYIAADGKLNFNSQSDYTGPADIVYTICDDNNFCIQATAHILIMDNLKLRIRAYLEGPLMENADARGSSHSRPLMRDNLRFNPFTGTNYLPANDPYSYAMPMFDLSSTYAHIGEGVQSKYRNIPDANSVFAVTGENAIVDWVFIELRNKNDYTEVMATRSALIQRDGDVVDLDGVSAVEFAGLRVDSCYIVLRHRNHFGVMSLVVSTSDLLDFTSPSTPVFDFGTSKNDGYDYTGLGLKPDVVLGYMSMWAGDFDGNGKIKFVNPDDDQNYLFFELLSYPTNSEFMANYNFAYGYTQGDFDLNGKSKYDNPDDDKNMLFYQVLFHPLNVNFISNFNFIIEQVPPRNN